DVEDKVGVGRADDNDAGLGHALFLFVVRLSRRYPPTWAPISIVGYGCCSALHGQVRALGADGGDTMLGHLITGTGRADALLLGVAQHLQRCVIQPLDLVPRPVFVEAAKFISDADRATGVDEVVWRVRNAALPQLIGDLSSSQ